MLCSVVGLALLVFGSGQSPLVAPFQPPFHRKWKVDFETQLGDVRPIGRLVCYSTPFEFGALDARSGQSVWRRSIPGSIGAHLTDDGRVLYVLQGRSGDTSWTIASPRDLNRPAAQESDSLLIACDSKTGKTLWKLRRTGRTQRLSLAGYTLYAGLIKDSLSAIDTRTHRVLWTTDLGRYGRGDGPAFSAVRIGDKVISGTDDGGLVCLNAADGKMIWHRDNAAAGRGGVAHIVRAAKDVVVGTHEGDLARIALSTGKILWRTGLKTMLGGSPVIVGDTVYATSWGTGLHAVDARIGSPKWFVKLAESRYDFVYGPMLMNGRLVARRGEVAYCFDPSGKKMWEWNADEEMGGEGGVMIGRLWLHPTSTALYLFTAGEPAPITSDPGIRKVLLAGTLSHIDRLGRDDEKTLKALGPEARDTLFALLKTRRAEYARNGGDKAFNALANTAKALAVVMQPSDTDAVLALLPDQPTTAQARHIDNVLVKLLAEKGDSSKAMPVFLARIRTRTSEREELSFMEFRAADSAMSAILKSDDPRATAFLIELLDNPKADPYERREAYWALPLHGGQAGIEAVLRWRSFDRKLRPLAERLGLDTLGTNPTEFEGEGSMRLLATHRDAAGVLWGLGECSAFGCQEDMWLLRHDGTRWVDAWFTGVTGDFKGLKELNERRQSETADGMTKDQFVKRGWVAEFVGNPTFGKDSDGDGLTDLAERRLGTNPRKPDTDGDGLTDGEDANPLVAARRLTEEEEIVAAAFEAMFKFDQSRRPATVSFPKNARYFEVCGRQGIVVPVHGRKGSALCDYRLQGTTDIGLGDSPTNEPSDAPLVKWVRKGEEAVVEIGAMYGFLAGSGYRMTLRRFGDAWLVVKVEPTWMS